MYMWYGKVQINTPFVHSPICIHIMKGAPIGTAGGGGINLGGLVGMVQRLKIWCSLSFVPKILNFFRSNI